MGVAPPGLSLIKDAAFALAGGNAHSAVVYGMEFSGSIGQRSAVSFGDFLIHALPRALKHAGEYPRLAMGELSREGRVALPTQLMVADKAAELRLLSVLDCLSSLLPLNSTSFLTVRLLVLWLLRKTY